MQVDKPVLYIVVPCYNEEEVLPVTSKMFLEELNTLIEKGKVGKDSKVMFVNDGSKDSTWKIITSLTEENERYAGLCLSRNRGHQNALLAGLMEIKDVCDISISIDCDGQDDIKAMEKMVDEYSLNGCDIVYGVRSDRSSDTFIKRATAQGFYKLLKRMGVEVVYNHADYRLLSSRALNAFSSFKEVNLYLRGMVPLVGFKSTSVYYERHERLLGKSHYSFTKMMALAVNGITSLSVKPISLIFTLGAIISVLGFGATVWSIIAVCLALIPGWICAACAIAFIGGLQLMAMGVVGEYIGKIYMETKARPRYIISERKNIGESGKKE